MPVDRGEFTTGVGVNYWAFDPVLQGEVERRYCLDDPGWGVLRLDAFGKLVGRTAAPNAAIVDTNAPVLNTHDRPGGGGSRAVR